MRTLTLRRSKDKSYFTKGDIHICADFLHGNFGVLKKTKKIVVKISCKEKKDWTHLKDKKLWLSGSWVSPYWWNFTIKKIESEYGTELWFKINNK